MIERFKTCLCYPRLIGQYVIDRKRTIFLYMVLLSLLCLVPTFIHIVRYSPTNNQAISNIKSEIMEKADDLEGGYILNGQLNVTKPATLTVGSVRVIINDNIDRMIYCIHLLQLSKITRLIFIIIWLLDIALHIKN